MPDYVIATYREDFFIAEIAASSPREAAKIAAGEDGWFGQGDDLTVWSSCFKYKCSAFHVAGHGLKLLRPERPLTR